MSLAPGRVRAAMGHPVVACVGPVTLVVLLVWLPFGFRLGALIEEWAVLDVFRQEGPVFLVGPGSLLAEHRLRPLTVLPHAIAFAFDPDSFDGWHALMIAILVVKGACCAALLWWATRSRLQAAFYGMLVVVYPADTMQLSFRAFHINASLAMVLLACGLQLYASCRRGRMRAAVASVAAGMALVVAAGLYEAALMLAALPVLVACVRLGWRRGMQWWWSGRVAIAGWVLAFAACSGFLFIGLRGSGTYQGAVFGSATSLSATVPARLTDLATIALPRALWGGWIDAVRVLRHEFHDYVYLALAVAAMAAILHRLRDDRSVGGCERGAGRRAVIVGLTLLVLGYLPYLASVPHVHTPQRTYLFATPGAALVLLALVCGSTRSRPFARLAACAIVLGAGLGAHLFQFDRFTRIYDTQRALLGELVRTLPQGAAHPRILVRDGSATLADLWTLRLSLRTALNYFLPTPLEQVDICVEPGGHWLQLDNLMRPGDCLDRVDHWMLRPAAPVGGPGLPRTEPPSPQMLPKDRIRVLILDASGDAVERPGAARGESAATAAGRRQAMLYEKPRRFVLDPFDDARSTDRYRWDVGRYWGIEFPQRGVGWRMPDWRLGPFGQAASVWKTQRVSTLLFELEPAGGDYRLTGRFSVILSDTIARATRMRVNGSEVAYRWGEGGTFVAPVPAGIVVAGTNVVEFDAPVDPDYFGLSLALEWTSLEPVD